MNVNAKKVNGWDVDLLQKAVDTCTHSSGDIERCPVFEKIPDSETNNCRIPPSIDEPIDGVLDALPGCNPVTEGPATASKPTSCDSKAVIGQHKTYFTDVTQTKQWEYVGCGNDDVTSRVLTPEYFANGQMTVSKHP